VAEEINERVSHAAEAGPVDDEPSGAALIAHAKSMLAERRMRRQFLPAELFHEPAWDMRCLWKWV
jgi:hypothetical protein